MTGVKLLLCQSRRLSLHRFFSSPFFPLHGSLSSSSSDNNSPKSIPIQPVSYAPKPNDPARLTHSKNSNKHNLSKTFNPCLHLPKGLGPCGAERTSDMSKMCLHPTRVAPLPEDRQPVPEGEVRKEESEEMVRERRRFQPEIGVWRRPFRIAAEEEKVVIPFPLLIKPEKKNEKRPVLDLMDAIREVKANATAKFEETMEAHVRLGIDQKRSELMGPGFRVCIQSLSRAADHYSKVYLNA